MEGDTMSVTLKDVNGLSNPSAPFKDKLFIASINIDRWTRVSDINGDAGKKEEDEARKREEEEARMRKEAKRDREEQEKSALPPVRLLRVRYPVCFAFGLVPMI